MGTYAMRGSALLALFSAACTSTRTEQKLAFAAVREDLAARVGLSVEPPVRTLDPGGLVPGVRELLAQPLTEDAAIRVALLNNRSVRSAFEELGVAAALLSQAGRLPNPLVSANAKDFDSGTEIELELSQPLLDLFLLPTRKRIARAELDETQARVARTLVVLVFEIRREFVRVRASQMRVQLLQQVRDSDRAALELVRELHTAGNVTDPELTAREVAASRSDRALLDAQAQAREVREPLNVLLGLWGEDTSWRVEGGLDFGSAALETSDLETRAVHASLELREQRARIESQARRAGIARLETAISQASLGVVGKREASDSEWGFGPSASIGLPLFDLGTARSEAEAAELRREVCDALALAVTVRSRARLLEERSTTLVDQARSIREVELAQHSRLVTETLREFNAMQIGVFDVFEAKERELSVRLEEIDLVRDLAIARLDMAELLSGSLGTAHSEERTSRESAPPREGKAHR